MTSKAQLRAVAPDEKASEPDVPLTLLEAVEDGDNLAILKAQRRIIAKGLTNAAENTQPQFNQQLVKLNELIAAEEARRHTELAESSVVAELEVEQWNGTGY